MQSESVYGLVVNPARQLSKCSLDDYNDTM